MNGVHKLLDGPLCSCLDKSCSAIPCASSTSQLGIQRHERLLRSAYSLECLVVSSLCNAGALLGYITWKRPKLALTMATAAAVVTAPYLGFAMAALDRWQVSSSPSLIHLQPPSNICKNSITKRPIELSEKFQGEAVNLQSAD